MRDLRKQLNSRDLVWLTVFVLLVGGAAGVLLENLVLPYASTWPGFSRLGVLSRQAPILITKREEIRINEGVNQLEVSGRVKNGLLRIYTHEGDFASGRFRVIDSRSGVVVASDGIVAVPADGIAPVRPGVKFTAITAEGKILAAKFLAFDRLTGLMFLEVQQNNLVVLRQTESTKLQPGEKLLAVWSSEARGSVSVRPLTMVFPSVENPGLAAVYEIGNLNAFLRTDWEPTGEALGGVVVDKDGQLAGFITRIGADLRLLRSEDLKLVFERFLSDGEFRWPSPKISYQVFSENQTELFGLPKKYGVLLKSSFGTLREDDFVYAVDGRELSPIESFQDSILSRRIGQKIKLNLIRDGADKELEISL